MKLSGVLLAFGLLVGGPAFAHMDTVLPIARDGKLTGLPPDFGPATLQVDFSGSDVGSPPVSSVVLRLGDRQTRLPACLTDLLRTQDLMQVKAHGSWYHTLSDLPPYMSVMFRAPGDDPAAGHALLFNLRNGRVMRMEERMSRDNGRMLLAPQIDLAKHCPAGVLATFMDTSGPDAVLTVKTMPEGIDTMPPLYVFDEHAELRGRVLEARELSDEVLERASQQAYWGRVEGHGWRLVPYVDAEAQAAIVGNDFDFHAEPGGLLLVQYLPLGMPCPECNAVSASIRGLAERHPEVSLRWVQVRVPAQIGRPE